MSREYSETLSGLRNDPSSFPEIRTVAEMRPLSQTIHLHHASKGLFDAYSAGKTPIGSLLSNTATYMHETMHWYDLVGTLWGAEFLDLIYLNLDIPETRPNTAEDEFHHIVRLYDEERRILYPLYYRLVIDRGRKHSPDLPWQMQYTCGFEFDAYGYQNLSRPILFVRFLDHDTGELIARQPLSVGALLETKAVASEIHTEIEMSAASTESDAEFRVQLTINSQERSNILYDPELTLYTAPAHMLSKLVGTQDAILTYSYAAAVANVSLNMTHKHFEVLKHPDAFEGFGEDALEAFRKRCDRGYAYAALIHHGDLYNADVPINRWLDICLQNAGLPTYAMIMKEAQYGISTRDRFPIQSAALSKARDELEKAGSDFFETMGASHSYWITLAELARNDLPVPYAFDSDGNAFCVGKAFAFQAFHPEALLDREYQLIKYRDNFISGARGVRIS